MCKPRIYFSISICSKYSLNYLFFAPCLGKIWCFHVLTLKNFIMREFFRLFCKMFWHLTSWWRNLWGRIFLFPPIFGWTVIPPKHSATYYFRSVIVLETQLFPQHFLWLLMYWVLCLKQDSWGVVNKLSRHCHRKITTIRNNNPVPQVNAFKS